METKLKWADMLGETTETEFKTKSQNRRKTDLKIRNYINSVSNSVEACMCCYRPVLNHIISCFSTFLWSSIFFFLNRHISLNETYHKGLYSAYESWIDSESCDIFEVVIQFSLTSASGSFNSQDTVIALCDLYHLELVLD